MRDGWRNVTLSLEQKRLTQTATADLMLEAQKANGRVIAFVNTVDAAIELYRVLESKKPEIVACFSPTRTLPRHIAKRLKNKSCKCLAKTANNPPSSLQLRWQRPDSTFPHLWSLANLPRSIVSFKERVGVRDSKVKTTPPKVGFRSILPAVKSLISLQRKFGRANQSCVREPSG